jgi:cytoskeleton protein RodZ
VASGVLVFRTRAASWIQVSDARGQSVLRRQVEPGETAAVSGTPPFNVTIGNASATEVQVRGKAFDLAGVARDNVARFEVK